MSEGREAGILGNRAVRERVFDRWGRKCCNCGTTENLRLDHIVSIACEGNDIESNLCVLCVQCHYKKHLLDKKPEDLSRRIKEGKARSIKTDGRPRNVPENYKELLNDFVFCRIGRKELSNRWGVTVTSRKDPTKQIPVDMVKLTDKVWYKEYLRDLGIERVENRVDFLISFRTARTKIAYGDYVGTIVYTDGRNIDLYRGINDKMA
jgi:hypothetical protein